jgi:Smg protein
LTNQDVFDVLIYLFENYYQNIEDDEEPDRDTLQRDLQMAGFQRRDILKAFDWLESLNQISQQCNDFPLPSQSLRLYDENEMELLNLECRGFLLFLEQSGVIDGAMREIIIDRVAALALEDLDLDQLKWIVLMLLFNLPGQEAALDLLEDLVLDEKVVQIH